MAEVRKVCSLPLRWLVTHTNTTRLDDAEMCLVERVPGLHERPYFLCLKHEAKDCKCVDAVVRHLEHTDLTDYKGDA